MWNCVQLQVFIHFHVYRQLTPIYRKQQINIQLNIINQPSSNYSIGLNCEKYGYWDFCSRLSTTQTLLYTVSQQPEFYIKLLWGFYDFLILFCYYYYYFSLALRAIRIDMTTYLAVVWTLLIIFTACGSISTH